MKIASAVALVALCLLSGCWKDDGAAPGAGEARVWVAIEPTQCLTNPWEQDWLSQGHDYGEYPKDPNTPGLEPEEFGIIRDFYAGLGVLVFEGKTAPKYDGVCLACSCPEGHTMYLQVRGRDIQAMIDLGYRVESPQ